MSIQTTYAMQYPRWYTRHLTSLDCWTMASSLAIGTQSVHGRLARWAEFIFMLKTLLHARIMLGLSTLDISFIATCWSSTCSVYPFNYSTVILVIRGDASSRSTSFTLLHGGASTRYIQDLAQRFSVADRHTPSFLPGARFLDLLARFQHLFEPHNCLNLSLLG